MRLKCWRGTGVVIFPEALRVTVATTPDRRKYLLFCQSPVEQQGAFVHDTEVSKVLVIHEPTETAFLLQTRVVREFFVDYGIFYRFAVGNGAG